MIKLIISTNGKQVVENLTKDKCTLGECAMIIHSMERMKQKLLQLDFKQDICIEEKK